MSIIADPVGPKFTSLSSDFYSIPKAQIFFQPEGTTGYVLLGDADNVTVEAKPDLLDRYTNESAVRTLARSFVTLVTIEVNMTLVQMTDLNRAMSLLGALTYDTQTGAAGEQTVLTAPVFNNTIYPLNHKQITASTIVVTDDSVLNHATTVDDDYTPGANWAILAGVATATASSTTLEETAAIELENGREYEVTFTVDNSSGGDVAVSLGGGAAGTSRSTDGTFTETITAGATQAITFTAAAFSGDIIIADINVVATDPTTYTIAVDYKVDAAAGYIQLINKHADTTDDVVITYTTETVVVGDKIARIGIGGQGDFRGAMVLRGTNALGPRLEVVLPLCQLHPSKPRGFIEEKNLTNVEINARVFRDDSQPAGFEFGYERFIK